MSSAVPLRKLKILFPALSLGGYVIPESISSLSPFIDAAELRNYM